MRDELERQWMRNALDDALGGLREDDFLAARVRARLREKRPAVKKKWSLGLILALTLVALALTALAVTLLFDQQWYLNNRFTAYREHDPEKYEAIVGHLAAAPEQSATSNAFVRVVVQDTAWVPELKYLSVSLRVTPQAPDACELHSMWDLDADGAYVGEGGSTTAVDDGEDRAMHWLWRHDQGGEEQPNRFGPPADMMENPAKTLLLLDCGDMALDGFGEPLMHSMDAFRTVDGAVIAVYECDLSRVNAGAAENAVDMQKLLAERPFTFSYRVVPYQEGMDDRELYAGGERGEVSFFLSVP